MATVIRQAAAPFNCNIHSVGDHDHFVFHYLCRLTSDAAMELNTREVKGAQWFSEQDLDDPRVSQQIRDLCTMAFSVWKEEGW